MMRDAIVERHFDTASVEPADRLEAWRRFFGPTFEFDTASPQFGGVVRTTYFGDLAVTSMACGPVIVRRTARQLRRDGLEHFVMQLDPADTWREADERGFTVPGGQLLIAALGRTTLVRTGALNSMIVSMSRTLLAGAVGDVDDLHSLVLDRETSGLLHDYLSSCVARAPRLPKSAGEGIARSAAHLLAACIAPSLRAVAAAAKPLQHVAAVRAKRYVDRYLHDVALSPERIAEAVGISRSTCFRIFASEGGVAAFIRRRRLEAVRRTLSSAPQGTRIGDLAFRFGFRDSADLSRSFRRAFDMTPSELLHERTVAATGPPLAAAQGSMARLFESLG